MIIKNCKCYNSELIIYYVQLNMQFVIDYGGELHQVQYPPDVNPSLSLSLSLTIPDLHY